MRQKISSLSAASAICAKTDGWIRSETLQSATCDTHKEHDGLDGQTLYPEVATSAQSAGIGLESPAPARNSHISVAENQEAGVGTTPGRIQWPIKPYYEHAGIVIFNCDCRDILPLLPKVDLVLTDPPYGDKETHAQHLSSITLRNGEPAGQALGFKGISQAECVDLAQSWVGISKGWVVFTWEWKFAHALDEAGVLVRLGIWRKPDGAPQFTGDRPGMGWEAVAICHRPGRKTWNGGGRHAVWTFPKGQNDSGHPTGKPLGLFSSFVSDFSSEGDLILDPFMGSGTTLVAAKQLGRRAIGIEIEERYCAIAAERLRQEVFDFSAPEPEPQQDRLFGDAA